MINKEIEGTHIIKLPPKEVTKFGTSGHVNVGKAFIGDVAEISIRKKWRICQRCSETFTQKENFSPDPKYCRSCYFDTGVRKIKEIEK